jgi:predicted dehydrogenase
VEWAQRYIGVNCPTYTDFDRMIRETKPETVIVTTPDYLHAPYAIRAMELGCDVICEKPMTINEYQTRALREAEQRTGKNVRITFNARYGAPTMKFKELLLEGRIGRVMSVNFDEYLDVDHGASYFRRWHRLREQSGTLLLQKSSHHFDQLNWWLQTDPVEVFGFGDLLFYGDENNEFNYINCRPCPYKEKCQFYWDITQSEHYMDMYVDNEEHDGYFRDGCVWRSDINIYDSHNLVVKYANGIQLNYSMTAYSPYEGQRIAFNGTKGRMEAWLHFRQPWPKKDYTEIRVTENFGDTEIIRVGEREGAHGGSDAMLKDHIFIPGTPDPYKQAAGTRAGAMSSLMGIAARRSMESGEPVKISDLTDIPLQAELA